MDALKSLLNQKKRQLNEIAIESKGSKIIKMSDVYKQREEEQKAKQAAEAAKTEEKHKIDKNDPSTSAEQDEESGQKQELSRSEVVRRLRVHSVPILFFGESHKEAQKRLRKLEIEKPELKEGWKNDFQSAMNKVDEELVQEVIKGASQDQAGKLNVAMPDVAGQKTWEQITADAYQLEKDVEPVRDCNIINSFIVHIMKRWGDELNARDEAVKRSAAGRLDATTHRQTMEHMKPLLKTLTAHTCDNDIRGHLCHIVRLCVIDRNYVQANNAYMEMAIGNAPWPIGVTRSGVHQRPGSAKAYVSNIAHVLNDETQRKYIHGLKRVLTKCQHLYPTDPSKCVEYVKNRE